MSSFPVLWTKMELAKRFDLMVGTNPNYKLLAKILDKNFVEKELKITIAEYKRIKVFTYKQSIIISKHFADILNDDTINDKSNN